MANVASPLLFKVSVSRVVLPSLKATLPEASGPDAGVTVALKVTVVPAVEGLSDELTLVEVDAAVTFSEMAAEVLP